MSLENRLQIQGLCAEIGKLVGSQEIDFCYHQGEVRVSVLSGEQADVQAVFMKAVGKYLLATRFPGGGADPAKAKEDFDRALQEYLTKVKI
jgi:hypothetical protein